MQVIEKSPKSSPVSATAPVASAYAGVLVAPGKIQLQKLDFPAPRPTEVRIRIEGCGICTSNLPVWEGKPWFDYPLEPGAPGHEAWGRVDAVGEQVHDLVIGDRVAMIGARGYAEMAVANAAEVLKLPAALDGQPVPAEPLGCAVNVFSRAQISAGQTVAIVGIGFLGALLTRLASLAHAQVIAITRRQFALDIARRFGAAEMLRLDDANQVIHNVMEITSGHGCERVIEVAGKQSTLDLSGELTAEQGKLVIAGYHQDGPRQVNMQLWNWRGLDVINAHERNPSVCLRGMAEAIRAIKSGVLDPVPLYTHSFALRDLGHGLAAAASRPDGFMKGLVLS